MRIRGYAKGTPCWSELCTSDPDPAVAFYEALFGWRHGEPGPAFRLAGLAVAGLVRPQVAAYTGGALGSRWLPYVSVEGLDELPGEVTAAGGTVLVPPMPVGELGRLAVFADPWRAAFGAWERGTFAGAQLAERDGTVCWTELVTRDEAGAEAFYGKVFGWTARSGEIAEGVAYAEWLDGGRPVAGLVPMGPEYPADAPVHWRTTIEVADCPRVVERCAGLGGRVLVGPVDVQVGTYAQVLDPVGAIFGVIQLAPQLRPPY